MANRLSFELPKSRIRDVDLKRLQLELQQSGTRIPSKAEKLDWLSGQAVALHSTPLRRSVRSSLWLNKLADDSFPGYRSLVEIDISRHGILPKSLRDVIMHRLFCLLINRHFSTVLEPTIRALDCEAMLSFPCYSSSGTLSLFSSNCILKQALDAALNAFMSYKPHPDAFAEAKAQLLVDWFKNDGAGTGFAVSSIRQKLITAKINSITFTDMTLCISRLLCADLDVFTIIAGNVTESDAIAIQDRVENILHVSSLSAYDTGAFVLPEGHNYLHKEVLSSDADCSGLEYYMQLGTDFQSRSAHVAKVLEHLLQPHVDKINSEYAYQAFRLSTYGRSVHGLLFRYFGPHSPLYAEARVNELLDEFGKVLASADEQKLALEAADIALQVDTSLEASDRDSEKAHDVPEVTKQELAAFFAAHLHPTSRSRTTLRIHSSRPAGDRLSPAARHHFEANFLPASVRQAVESCLHRLDAHMSDADEISLKWYKANIKRLIREDSKEADVQNTFKVLDRIMKELPSTHDRGHVRRKGIIVIRDLEPFRKTFRLMRRNGVSSSCSSKQGAKGVSARRCWPSWTSKVSAHIDSCFTYGQFRMRVGYTIV